MQDVYLHISICAVQYYAVPVVPGNTVLHKVVYIHGLENEIVSGFMKRSCFSVFVKKYEE